MLFNREYYYLSIYSLNTSQIIEVNYKFGKILKKLSIVIEEKKELIMNDKRLTECEKREIISAMLNNKMYLPVQSIGG